MGWKSGIRDACFTQGRDNVLESQSSKLRIGPDRYYHYYYCYKNYCY